MSEHSLAITTEDAFIPVIVSQMFRYHENKAPISILRRAWTMPVGEKKDMMLMELTKKAVEWYCPPVSRSVLSE